MSYTPRDIKDRIAIGDDIFTVEDLGNNQIRLIPAPEEVIEVGTDINKALLQPMEDAIADLVNNPVTLPTASATTKGGIKVGSGLSMDGDTMNATVDLSNYYTITETEGKIVDHLNWDLKTINGQSLFGHGGNINIINAIYPVGSVYISINNVNPSTLFSGTSWTKIASEIPTGRYVFGNGNALALTSGGSNYGHTMISDYNEDGCRSVASMTLINTPVGSKTGGDATNIKNRNVGVPTKAQLDASAHAYRATGLEMPYITIYLWKRTA